MNEQIGHRPPTAQEQQAAVIITAMITAIVRNDSHTASDVGALKEDLFELLPDAKSVVDLTLQTTASLISGLCHRTINADPEIVMRLWLERVRDSPTQDIRPSSEG
ncbi:hypothetical protein [Aeromicrobium stalagmiti]|uniref:hypothetical protein n=1 Tax=Aeromicrobium stalagmiti TaxID=2738988 RepID=UPI001567D00C|nr:hypothetical protein [Aeromicrobium stalagmiti]NRQ51561.1 hypothetical protein [Aeromicrobium stalagmiti]